MARFTQRKKRQCRAMVRILNEPHQEIRRNAFSAWVLIQPSIAGSSTFSRLHNFSGYHHFLWVKQVNGDGDFSQMTPTCSITWRPARRAFVAALQMVPILQSIQRDATLVTLFKQMANALLNGPCWRQWFQDSQKLPQWQRSGALDLNVGRSPTLPLRPIKNPTVRISRRARSAVDAHQNRVFAVLARTKVVLCQCQRTNIVAKQNRSLLKRFPAHRPAPSFPPECAACSGSRRFPVDQSG